jgi:hypothetical protein
MNLSFDLYVGSICFTKSRIHCSTKKDHEHPKKDGLSINAIGSYLGIMTCKWSKVQFTIKSWFKCDPW